MKIFCLALPLHAVLQRYVIVLTAVLTAFLPLSMAAAYRQPPAIRKTVCTDGTGATPPDGRQDSLDQAIPHSVSDKISKTDVAADTVKRRQTLASRVIEYFLKADPHTDKRFDFGLLPGPTFSSSVGLGLGIVATGLYSMDRRDPTLQKSNVTLFGDVTTKGFMMIGLKGNNLFPHERYRLDYRFHAYIFPTEFYGIGYSNGDRDGNKTEYDCMRFEAMLRFMFKVAPDTYAGPMVNLLHVKGHDVAPSGLHLFAGQPMKLHCRQAGFTFSYDTRDFMLNAHRGWFVQLDQLFAPRFLGNDYCFSTSDLTISTYREVWKGGILAGEWHSRFNHGNPAWGMMSEAGTNDRMRGYYEGRYRDKHIMEAQAELRQHVWQKHGFAVWAGLGQVFPKLQALRWSRILPNAGIGYRWEFKKRVNVRVDYGFTRHGGGFIFNINEAF